MAVLVMLLLLIMGGAAFLVSELNSIRIHSKNNKQTVDVLAQAKEALIGYAASYAAVNAGQPGGYFPCPDMDGNGTSTPANNAANCQAPGANAIGRLPWFTLGLPPLRDGDGECLWYAVSGKFKASLTKQSLTTDTDGAFVVKDESNNVMIGSTSYDQAMAIVFAPGKILGMQDRSFTAATRTECGSTTAADAGNQPGNYLDPLGTVNNANGFDTSAAAGTPGSQPIPTLLASMFVAAPAHKGVGGNFDFNDAQIVITPADMAHVYDIMNTWVANRVQTCLAAYAAANGNKFSWMSLVQSPPDYSADANATFGRIPTTPTVIPWPLDPADPVNNVRCFNNAVAGTPDWSWWWWGNSTWKEMVFFGFNNNFAPSATASFVTTLDAVGQNGIAIVAGRRLPLQVTRSANKGNITAYLENENEDPNVDADFLTTAPAPFNDVAVPVSAGGGMGGGMGPGMGGGMGGGM